MGSGQSKNILDRDFNPKSPNETWCTDITYIWTNNDGFLYLNSVMDLYSRKIIEWTLSRTLEVSEILECVKRAKTIRSSADPVIIQSDRGIHYTSNYYKELTKGLVCSYSRKGNPWDNACIESYHSLLKREWLNRLNIQDYAQAYRLVFEYLEGFYNAKRIHSHCNYQSIR
ncbi:transposase [Massilimicrobiota sp. An105]|uniref:IS3 family transposase n=1 Tax=Massilimicrobiota sp. An105 TaxID=1965540 RepID=UPI000B3676BE|nr:IS3 family transposase [Massilimicrobiota sp. An105]OUQ80740.1 transposase [Massilimicrobiota sp. An105]